MAANDREEVALSSSELDDVLNSAGLTEGAPAAPKDDLELYGVWVKVKPQTVPQTLASSAPAELADLETAESAELTDDEQDLLAELESGIPEPAEEGEMPSIGGEPEGISEIPTILGSETLSLDVAAAGSNLASDSLDELSLEEPPAESLDQEIASLDEELASLGTEPVDASAALPALEEEEISLEEPLPEATTPTLEEDISLEPAGEEELQIEESLPSLEEPPAIDETLPSLDEDLILEEPPAEGTALGLETFGAGEEELVLDEPTADEIGLEEPAPEGRGGVAELEAAEANEPETPFADGEEGLPGIDLETEILPSARQPSRAARGPGESKPDAAALILQKIEQELRAIRGEISDLKEELTVLRRERAEAVAGEKLAAGEAAAGFFGGEEDETIALTGDELDNILSTADITEGKESEPAALPFEAPADELGTTLPEVAGIEEENVLDEDILEHAGDELEAPEVALGGPAAELEDTDLRIPEEELVDASGEEGITDESSLLSAEPLSELAQGEELVEPEDVKMPALGEGAPETADEGMLPVDLAADLAAEADAAVAEPRFDEAVAPVGEETLPEPTVFGLDLSEEIELDLGADAEPAAEPSLDLAGEPSLEIPEEPSLELEAEPTLEVPEVPSLELPGDLSLEIPEEPEAGAEEPLATEAPEAELEMGEEAPEQAAPKAVPDDLRDEIKSVLAYLDQLLEALPDEKIEEFAKSEYFGVYKKLFVELGLED